jgi:hypothetical protein
MKWIAMLMTIAAPSLINGQSIVGDWQVTKQTNCLENEVYDTLKTDSEMLEARSPHSNHTPKVMSFRADNTGEESIKVQNKKKPANRKKFHYKFDGQNIYILDKKSHLIVGGFVVETLTTDALVYYSEGKECEKTTLVRVK